MSGIIIGGTRVICLTVLRVLRAAQVGSRRCTRSSKRSKRTTHHAPTHYSRIGTVSRARSATDRASAAHASPS